MDCTAFGVLNVDMKNARQTAKKRQFRRTYIREWRQHREMTLEALAGELDMTASHFSMLERGQRGYTQETLEAIADVLKTSTAALLTRNPQKEGAEWSAWEQADPADRKLALELLKTVKNTGI
jgi:transcriptional regulator with XRE-family HTH domain